MPLPWTASIATLYRKFLEVHIVSVDLNIRAQAAGHFLPLKDDGEEV